METQKTQAGILKKYLPGLIAFALILATIIALSGERTLYGDPNGEIPLVMPSALGPYRGNAIWFCQNDQCGRSFSEDKIIAAAATNATETAAAETDTETHDAKDYFCPSCDTALNAISIGELKLLPANTPIIRKEYKRDFMPPIIATVVFSGMERRSIHKPQRCLVGQGNRITNEYSMEFDVGGGEKVSIRILEIQQIFGSPDGKKTVANGIYAYWLFNPERETDSHFERFYQMSVDNALRNYRPRWGYASISLDLDPMKPNQWKDQLSEFVKYFYPLIRQTRKDLDAQRNNTITITRGSAELNTEPTSTPNPLIP